MDTSLIPLFLFLLVASFHLLNNNDVPTSLHSLLFRQDYISTTSASFPQAAKHLIIDSFSSISTKTSVHESRKLWNGRIQDPETLKKFAATSIVPNKTVFGAVLTMYPEWDYSSNAAPTSSLGEHDKMYKEGISNLTKELPFKVSFWPYAHTKLCPQNLHSRFRGHGHMANRTENGMAHSHFQLWQDFAFFDYDVIAQYQRGDIKPGELYSSTDYSSHGGLFQAYSNGTLLRNGLPFKDDDILVVMEDISDVAITNANITIIDELTKMNSDVLFLGWCDTKDEMKVPSCVYAYAITRKAASFLVKHFEPCSLLVEETFTKLCKNDAPNRLSWRLAHSWSHTFNSNYPRHNDHTKGIFHKHLKQHIYQHNL